MEDARRAGQTGAAGVGDLPHWDLTTLFPSMDSREFREEFAGLKAEIPTLAALADEYGIRKPASPAVDATVVARFEEATRRLNSFYERYRIVGVFLHGFISTDATNEQAQGLQSELRTAAVTLDQLWTRYVAWVGGLDVEALLAASATAREHELLLRKAAVQARHQMSEAEENLGSELAPASVSGWARLHSDMTALITVPVALEGEDRVLPMSAVRALANHADRAVRQAAYEAEIAAWQRVEVPLAAALNGVKGYQGILRRRRGWEDDIEPTLLSNSIDRDTLAAMQAACVESFPDFRRYAHAKARALGLERLSWFDVNAPVGGATRAYSWADAEDFIREQFGAYSPRMAEFADRTFRERWIDAEPRPGKEGGAFCAGSRPGKSLVLMNYDGSLNSISTLAHELGHAYHNLCLEARAPLQSRTPSTLAETASIFCETIAFEAVLARTTGAERLAALDTSLQRDLMVVVDIHSRFLFERGVFERRRTRELAPSEFSALMLEAQGETYGDAVDPDTYHRYMWAVKGHYYGPTFYNYPYTFGLLFGLGLYARYQADGDAFRAGYDDLLSATGLHDAATLAARFGIDTRSIDFWRGSLDVIRRNIAQFEAAAA